MGLFLDIYVFYVTCGLLARFDCKPNFKELKRGVAASDMCYFVCLFETM